MSPSPDSGNPYLHFRSVLRRWPRRAEAGIDDWLQEWGGERGRHWTSYCLRPRVGAAARESRVHSQLVQSASASCEREHSQQNGRPPRRPRRTPL
jgi:hypothetical protein